MQSLKAKFNGNTPEVVKKALDDGVLEAMEVYGVKDVKCMLDFLREVTPDKKFQLAKPKNSDLAGPDAFDRLCEKLWQKIISVEAANNTLADENAELKKQIDYYKAIKWCETRPIIEGLLQYCEEE